MAGGYPREARILSNPFAKHHVYGATFLVRGGIEPCRFQRMFLGPARGDERRDGGASDYARGRRKRDDGGNGNSRSRYPSDRDSRGSAARNSCDNSTSRIA